MDLTWASRLISSQIKESLKQQQPTTSNSKPLTQGSPPLSEVIDKTLINHTEILTQLDKDFKTLLSQLNISTSNDTQKLLLQILSQSQQNNLSTEIQDWLQLVLSPKTSESEIQQFTQQIQNWINTVKVNISQNISPIFNSGENIPKELLQVLGLLERNQLSDILKLDPTTPTHTSTTNNTHSNFKIPASALGQFQSEIQSLVQNFAPKQTITSHLEKLATKFLNAKNLDVNMPQETLDPKVNSKQHFPLILSHLPSGEVKEPKALLRQLNIPLEKIEQFFLVNTQTRPPNDSQINPPQVMSNNYSSILLNTKGQAIWFPPNPQLPLIPADLQIHQEVQIPPTYRSVEDLKFLQTILQTNNRSTVNQSNLANPTSSLVPSQLPISPTPSSEQVLPPNKTPYTVEPTLQNTEQIKTLANQIEPSPNQGEQGLSIEQLKKLGPIFKSFHQHHYNLEANFPPSQTPQPTDKQQLLSSLLNLKQASLPNLADNILKQFSPSQAIQTQLYEWIKSPEALLPAKEDLSESLQKTISQMFKEKPLLSSEEFQKNIETLLQKSDSNSSQADSIPLKKLLHFTNWTKLENEPPQENQRDQSFFWSQDGELYHSKIQVRDERKSKNSSDEESNPIVNIFTTATHIGEIAAKLQRKAPHSEELMVKIEDETGRFTHEFDEELQTFKNDLLQLGLILKDFIYSAKPQLRSFKETSTSSGDSTLDLRA